MLRKAGETLSETREGRKIIKERVITCYARKSERKTSKIKGKKEYVGSAAWLCGW